MADEESEAYIQKHNIYPRLREAIREVVTNQPARPFAFLRDHFAALDEREIDAPLSNHVPRYDESAHDDTDIVPLARDMPSRDRRGAISAEVYNDEEIQNYKRIVVPKDYKTMQALQRVFENIKLLKSCDEDQRSHIFDAMAEHNFQRGDVIIKQGDPGDYFYVIDSGEVEVTKSGKVVASIGEWGTFGELALMHGGRRQATVACVSETLKVWAIDRNTYRKILMSLQRQKREKYDEVLKKMRILDNLQPWERLAVADALESVSFDKSEDIVREGEHGNEFFIIIQGTAHITKLNKNTIEQIGELGPNDYFGELALILSRPRAATVTAKTFLKCVKLDRARFERVLGPVMDILKRTDYYDDYVRSSV